MRSNKLQPYLDKTELLWCATAQRQHQPPTSSLLIDGCSITPVQSARDLGIYVDCDLSMRTHAQRTVSRCFAALRQLRQIRRSVPSATLQMLVVALVHSRLDYGNGVLVGLPAYLTRRLQSVLNTTARLIYRLMTCDHVSDALISLHCMAAGSGWSHYKLAVFWRARFCMAMHHVTSVRWPVSTTCLVDEYSVLPMPTASWYHPSNCQQSAAEPLRLRLHLSGIHCQLTSLGQIYHLLSTAKRFLFKKSYSGINWSFVKKLILNKKVCQSVLWTETAGPCRLWN